MHRFLVFHGQTQMQWQDEIDFTEKMGQGNAFPDALSANRKFHPKVPDNRLGYFSNDPSEGEIKTVCMYYIIDLIEFLFIHHL